MFISFEGIDGAGKSTHVDWIAQWLTQAGHDVLITREPGGTALAESIRSLLLQQSMGPMAELLLAFAARSDHLETRIAPALAQGTWVVCDRFTDSTFAYQGGGRTLDWGLIECLEARVIEGLQPDLTLWFDIPPAVAAERRAAARAADRFESEDLAFFERVRAAYLRRAEAHPHRFVRINGLNPIDEIRFFLDKVLSEKFSNI